MALIKCPECGKEISDKAKACINCGFPIEALSDDGMVKIRVNPLKGIINGEQEVSIFLCETKTSLWTIPSDTVFVQDSNGKTFVATQTLWEGNVGDTAEIHFDSETDIIIHYHFNLMHWGGECHGIINPAKSRKYVVSPRQGILSTKLVLQAVDFFDAD